MQETLKAQLAFEDYWNLGPGRSLLKLAEKRVAEGGYHGTAESCRRHIAQWSTEHNWQARIAERIMFDAEQQRNALREHSIRIRRAVADGLTRRIEKALAGDGLQAESIGQLQDLVKLALQAVGEPLADRHELTGANGGPVEVDIPPNGDLARFLRNAADLAISTQAGGDVPGEAGGD